MRILVGLLALTACTAVPTPAPEPLPQPPSAVSDTPTTPACVPKELKQPPKYVDTDEALLAAIDAAARYQLVFAGRLQRIARLSEVEPVVAACPRG